MNFKDAIWPDSIDDLKTYLMGLANEKYKNFSKGLIPGDFLMLGVNVPTLKRIAKEIYKSDWKNFLEIDDEKTFEIKFLKGQVIANITSPCEYEEYFWRYLPSIDDWSSCDSFISASKVIKSDRGRFFEIAKKLIESEVEFENRVGFVILLNYFVDEEYKNDIFNAIRGFERASYYANMGLAWLLCVLYVSFPKETFVFLKENKFNEHVIKYTIRKVRDSYQISSEEKKRILELNFISK